MFFLLLFRLKAQKIAGILILLLLTSFGLQYSQDILTQLDKLENITLHHNEFRKIHQTVDQTNISEDDQDVIHQHKDLKLPQIFIIRFFLNSFKSFQIKGITPFSKSTYCENIPLIGLFLNNKALLI
ncbi:MAG: hypothetical protein H7098_00945 [Oligoflexus sp.]|nr:hypothetical protein [Pseudopedobacter sp.]